MSESQPESASNKDQNMRATMTPELNNKKRASAFEQFKSPASGANRTPKNCVQQIKKGS